MCIRDRHYFDQSRFFRVVPGFIAQFGVHRDFNVHGKWREYFIVDDPPQQKNPVSYTHLNYIRNSVKATVDAYDGTVHFYVFEPGDPLLQAYRNLFPDLFEDASAMPADLRRHVRYPELIFRVQADIYRLFHMRDADTFYNKSDAWDTAKFTNEQGGTPGPLAPCLLYTSRCV